MKESIGSTFLYNIIFIFIIIVFGLLSATISYYKGFKVNTRILASINKYSGYNDSASKEIENHLSTIGYTINSNNEQCGVDNSKGVLQTNLSSKYLYCVYLKDPDVAKRDTSEMKNKYYSYGVKSYIYVDLPIVGKFKVPVYSKGERIYRFTGVTNPRASIRK